MPFHRTPFLFFDIPHKYEVFDEKSFDEMAFDEKYFDEVAFGFDEMVFDQVVDSIKMAFNKVVGHRRISFVYFCQKNQKLFDTLQIQLF
jgi:hypothetical protein